MVLTLMGALCLSQPAFATGFKFDVRETSTVASGDGITVFQSPDTASFVTVSVDPVTSGSNADSSTTQSDSGLEFVSNQITILRGCDDNQILKWDETDDDWNCEADGAGSVATSDITGIFDIDADTNLVGGTLLTLNTNGVLDAAVATSDVTGTFELDTDTNFVSSSGITNTNNRVSVDVLVSGSNDDSSTTQADGGLEFVGEKLSLIRGCADNELLTWDETEDDWNCEAAAGGGSLEFVSNTAASDDATIEITGIASGYDYVFGFQNVQPATDSVTLEMRTSTDGGSTYESGASDYNDSSANVSSMTIAGTLGNATGEGATCDLILYNPGDTTTHTTQSSTGVKFSTAGAGQDVFGAGGKRNSADDVTAVQFFFSSGNVASGNITVWRRSRS